VRIVVCDYPSILAQELWTREYGLRQGGGQVGKVDGVRHHYAVRLGVLAHKIESVAQ